MSRLQRSSVSFRRQGSSGRIWDDPMRGGLDHKGLQPGASILAGDPLPRAVPSSAGSLQGASASIIAESPEVASAGSAASTVIVVGEDGTRHERPARRRRRISSAFCACMGHPPASHAQQ
ncbi:uncharacterized protein LOC133892229 [Phragmites australis]|uniref:uncharacterized protein LOC133892229 n=1 Tax=Phragmites australis TaxID=29695 RepID=UPI002D791E3A|nr:uncharacterized protein LOC133892229 [Phragmites australis]